MGLSRRNREQRDCARPQARLRQAAARVSQHADPRIGTLCGIARRADGQQRGGPPEHRRGPHCADGHHAHRRADCVGRVPKESGDRRGHASGRARAGGNCTCSGWSQTAACTRTRSISTRCCGSRARAAWSGYLCTHLWTAATPGPLPARATLRSLSRRCASMAWEKWPRERPLLRHGPRQALGARAQGL